jgi:hypothetical protein
MKKIILLAAFFTSSILAAEAYYRCKADCEYFTRHKAKWGDSYDTINIEIKRNSDEYVKFMKITKKITSRVNVLSSAFSILQNNCFALGLANSQNFNIHGLLRPRLVHPDNPELLLTPESVCIERKSMFNL